MKSKQHRLHYNRNQMNCTDPRRICPKSATRSGTHRVDGPVMWDWSGSAWTRCTAYCRWCGLRIESLIDSAVPDDLRVDINWSGLEWRAELYLIEEVPW